MPLDPARIAEVRSWFEKAREDMRAGEQPRGIGRACTSILPELEPVLRCSAPLTEYAWKVRYPGDPDEPTLGEVTEALRVARDVYEAIAARLPGEAIP